MQLYLLACYYVVMKVKQYIIEDIDLLDEQYEEFNKRTHDNSFKVHKTGVTNHHAKIRPKTDRKNAIRYPLPVSG